MPNPPRVEAQVHAEVRVGSLASAREAGPDTACRPQAAVHHRAEARLDSPLRARMPYSGL
jgi:hypothetical protein